MVINNSNARNTIDMKVFLSALWIFAVLNYLYCDVISFMDSNLLKQYLSGTVSNMQLTQGFLLGGSILMEIPIALTFLSRILKYKANRWVNMSGGIAMSIVQLSSLLAGKSTSYYIFFSIIEISCTMLIFIAALKWSRSADIH